MVLHFCTFLLNPHFDLEPDYIVRKPIKRRCQDILSVQKYSQLFTQESNTFLIPPIHTNGTECTQIHRHTHTRGQPLYGSLDFVWNNLGEPVPEGTFHHLLDFQEQNEDNTGNAPTIWMDCYPIQTNWCPHLCHPRHFYAGCPSLHNPPNLSWLGTGTKYASLHTRWRGCTETHAHTKVKT